MAKVNVIVQQDPEKPIEKNVLAKAITDISKSMFILSRGGLNERAIIVLVADSSGVGRPDVRAVLQSLRQLAADYTK